MTMIRRRVSAAIAATMLLAAGAACSNDEQHARPAVDVSAAPADVTWRSVAGLEVPTSRDDGPAKTSPPQGYSHTPQGAALAAANGQAALATAPDSTWPDVVRTVTAPGAGRDQFAQARTLMSVSGSVDSEDAATFAGFKVTEYTPEKAIVLLATTTPPGPDDAALRTAYPVQLAWTGGDWKLVLPTQSDDIDATEIADLDGFTTWKEDGS